MSDDLVLSVLTTGQRRLLQIIAEHGVLGGTEEEVAAYLIAREIDDMLRSGCIKLGSDS